MKKLPYVLKYELQDEPVQTLSVPINSEILSVHTQVTKGVFGGERPFIWMLVKISEEQNLKTIEHTDLRIAFVPTGATLDDPANEIVEYITKERFIGAIHYTTARLVYHLFDATK